MGCSRVPLLLVASAVLAAPLSAQTLQEQVLERINVERWNNGQLPPLKGQANLDAAANGHSQAMGVRNFFMHCDPDTLTSPGDRMVAAGYAPNALGENLAAGNATAAATVAQWMASPGHRANILSTGFREVGNGHFFDSADSGSLRFAQSGCVSNSSLPAMGHYWTQKFGRRDAVMPVVIAREAWQVATCSIDVHLYGSGWASQYRLSNDGTTWSPWQAFSPDVLWTLSGPAGGTATVHAQIRNTAGTVRQSQDSVRLAVACTLGDAIFGNGFQGG